MKLDRIPALAARIVLVALAVAGARLAQAQSFTYDAAGRLTQVTYDGGTTIAYTYDASGNLLSQSTTPQPPSGGGGGGGGGCFIATAAYGSPLDGHVQSLREFRERHLRTNAPGRAFIRLYERTSPPLAEFIAEREWARALARFGLAPIVLGVEHPWSAAVAAIALSLAVWLARRRRRASGSSALG